MSNRIKHSELWNVSTNTGEIITGDKAAVTITSREKIDGDYRYTCICNGVTYEDVPRRGVQALADRGEYSPRISSEPRKSGNKETLPQTYEAYLQLRITKIETKFTPMLELYSEDEDKLQMLLTWKAKEIEDETRNAESAWNKREETLKVVNRIKEELAELKNKALKAIREENFDYLTEDELTKLKNKKIELTIETAKL